MKDHWKAGCMGSKEFSDLPAIAWIFRLAILCWNQLQIMVK